MIKIGNNDILLKVGSQDVQAAYLGSTLVYSPTTTTTTSTTSTTTTTSTTSTTTTTSTTSTTSTTTANPIPSGAFVFYDFGNPSSYSGTGTNVNDLSGNGRNGTLRNGPTYSSDNGGIMQFVQASSQYMDYQGYMSNDVTTIVVWKNTDSTFQKYSGYPTDRTAYGIIWTNDVGGSPQNKQFVPIIGNNAGGFATAGSTYVGPADIQTFHQYSVTVKSNSSTDTFVKTYLDDGTTNASQTLNLNRTGTPSTSNKTIYLNRDTAVGDRYGNGYMMAYLHYNRQLSDAEIASIYSYFANRYVATTTTTTTAAPTTTTSTTTTTTTTTAAPTTTTTTAAGTYTIGNYYAELGGYVYYLDGNGGGQVAAPLNAPSGAVFNLTSSISGALPYWGSEVVSVTGTFTHVTSGSVNTIAMAVTSASFDRNASNRVWNEVDAYNSASSNVNGGFTDWYIPSIDALGYIYDNLASQGIAGPWTGYASSSGGTGKNRMYLSSTQYDTNSEWTYQMQDGPFTSHGPSFDQTKSDQLMFRPVRTFTAPPTTTSTTTTTTAAPTTTSTTAFSPQYWNVRKCNTSDPTTALGMIAGITLTAGQAVRPTQLGVTPTTALPGYENACYELISTAVSGTICGIRAPSANCATNPCNLLPTTTTTTTAAP